MLLYTSILSREGRRSKGNNRRSTNVSFIYCSECAWFPQTHINISVERPLLIFTPSLTCIPFRDKACLMSNQSIWLLELVMAKVTICPGFPEQFTTITASYAVLTPILSQKYPSLDDKLYYVCKTDKLLTALIFHMSMDI